MAGGGGGTPATAAGSTLPAEQLLAAAAAAAAAVREGSAVSAATATTAIRASIESAVSFADEENEEDEDSPRFRGRQYDDRWKVPGHAESVLASFVERLEHRGHHGHVDADGNPVSSSSADALAEARTNRGAAIAVLGGGVDRSGAGDRSARGVAAVGRAAGTVAAMPSAAGTSSKKRRSVGGRHASKTGVKRKDGGGAGKVGARREPSGKGETSTVAISPRRLDRVSAVGSGGSWSRFGSMAMQTFQRAAEAFVGVQKDVEEGEAQQDRRTGQERTREAASAFLSSSSPTLPDQE